MDLYAPTISPLNTSKQLQTASDVTSTPEVADGGASDTTVMYWGCWEPPATNPQATPFQAVRIQQDQICNGEAWCWYSVTDKIGNTSYSDVAKPQIINTGQYLDKPEVTPANTEDRSAGMRVVTSLKNNFNTDLSLRDSDIVTAVWWIYDTGSTNGRRYASPRTLAHPLTSGVFTFQSLTPAPAESQYAIVSFEVERLQHSSTTAPDGYQKFSSDVARIDGSNWYTPTPGKLPAPRFDVTNNVIDLDRISGDISASIPKTDLITAASQVTLIGLRFDQGGNLVPGSDWSQSATVPFTPYPYNVPRAKVAVVPNGGDYLISYSVDNVFSPTSAAEVQQTTPPSPTVKLGSLWGWGDAEYGTLG
ncbi:hypothetical protein CAL29_01050 [Bordetella genomosp. 10]|uniref:Uncharacterized protein n=1 Tax=Bordetella genomosp. 10 TaxID=1416804 RepID=A0A261SI47_9BORD|nr:hypothetical protein [Bordetella genomosp. 10]OZI37056.1 hypothetical protein CAL29_01050 [Bordetella genomosp. 10]